MVSREQALAITWEIVLLSMYWIQCALEVGVPEQTGKSIWKQVQGQVRARWDSRFGFVYQPIDQFFSDLETKGKVWDALAEEGGEPIAILNEATSEMELNGNIPRGERQKLLVLFLDLVPVEEIGQAVAEIEQDMNPDNLPF